jgi:RHS repeat-associated protein
LNRLREYVWLYDMPVAQVVYGDTELYTEGGCSGGGGGCSIIDNEKERIDRIRLVLIITLGGIGIIGVLTGRGRRYSIIAVIMMMALIMIAPYKAKAFSRGVVFYYHNDHLNTPVKMTDEKGNIVWEVVSKHPFGSFEVSSKEVVLSDYTGNSNDSFNYKIENPIRFPGQYDDSDTKDVRSIILNNAEGLYYNYHRWYNPDIGRYMEVDPYKIIRFSRIKACYKDYKNQKIKHRYIYSINNPVMFFDILGLDCAGVEKCRSCLYLNSNDDVIQYYARYGNIICGEEAKQEKCAENPDDLRNWVFCGCTVFYRSGKVEIYITNECNHNCLTLLHELGHAYFNMNDSDELDNWVIRMFPHNCCSYHY